MSCLLIEPAKSVSFTGHRIISEKIDLNELKNIITLLIKKGYDTFLVGMAIGFDTICFHILEELKNTYNIRIIACIPCPEQPLKFNEEQKKEYYRILSVCDEKVVISEKYTSNCMTKRNKFMVDFSSVIVTYVRKDKSGAKQTENYAKKKGLWIIKI